MEKRLGDEPGSVARKGNYIGLKEIYEIISKDRDEFLEMMEWCINLHIIGDAVKNQNISLSVINEILMIWILQF
ncbi:hypothetical protein [Methanobrevibacter sp.]|uniref:hypothetical protein n=1 Tax=Methanobrevibacter sp. TaxID=66852 RepID=UPI00388DDC97